MTDMNIEELKQLAEAATPGLWSYHDRDNVIYSDKDEVVGSPRSAGTHSLHQRSRNGFWIAAANPAVVLELIRQRDELLAALREVADWTERYTLPGHPVVTVARRAIAKAEG